MVDARTRWGSCTPAAPGHPAGIRLSWRLALAPPAVADYVAAHECAHLLHPHHGPAFWAETPPPDRRRAPPPRLAEGARRRIARVCISLPSPLRGGVGGGGANWFSAVRLRAADNEPTPPSLTLPRKGEGNRSAR
ncbi:MAG: M48 family metallopeptidase [Caulobacteraceae bacterium]